jgi:hypothetical protein
MATYIPLFLDPAVDGPGIDGPAVDGPAVDGPGIDGPAVDGPGIDVIPGTIPKRPRPRRDPRP